MITVPKSEAGFSDGLVQAMITELTDLVVVTPVGAVGTTAAIIPNDAEFKEYPITFLACTLK